MRGGRFRFDFHHFPVPSADTRIPRKGRSLSNASQFGPQHLTSLSNSSRRTTPMSPIEESTVVSQSRISQSNREGTRSEHRDLGAHPASRYDRNRSRADRELSATRAQLSTAKECVVYVLAELLAGLLRNDPLLLFRRRKTSSPLPSAKLIPLSSRVSCEARVVRGSARGSLSGC